MRREENKVSQATIKPTPPAPVTLAEFDEIFKAVKNWGRWGPDDELGTLNYITADTVRAAAATVRSGRRATMAIAMNTAAGPDNPSPVTHHVVQGHDIDIGSSGVTFATDYVGLAFHGDPVPPGSRSGNPTTMNSKRPSCSQAVARSSSCRLSAASMPIAVTCSGWIG